MLYYSVKLPKRWERILKEYGYTQIDASAATSFNFLFINIESKTFCFVSDQYCLPASLFFVPGNGLLIHSIDFKGSLLTRKQLIRDLVATKLVV